jgi:D-sedoheptulose 7-phosphate isomerase
MQDFVTNSLNEAHAALAQFISDPKNAEAIHRAVTTLSECFKNGGKALSCGNGGSLCDASHFAEELTGRYRKDRKALPAQSINDPGHMTCVANDYGYEFVFSRYVEAWGKNGDVLLAISTSGNSANVIKATEAAKACGMKVIGLLGKDGGKLAPMVDIPILVNHPITDRIQEVHIKVIHILIEGVERQLFPENYR